jgi:hypothetical protein
MQLLITGPVPSQIQDIELDDLNANGVCDAVFLEGGGVHCARLPESPIDDLPRVTALWSTTLITPGIAEKSTRSSATNDVDVSERSNGTTRAAEIVAESLAKGRAAQRSI